MNNKRVIIVFSGRQFSGKDTAAKILLEEFKSLTRIGIADAIKREYSKRTGLSLSEIENNKSEYRQDLINLGNEGRAVSADYWLEEIAACTGSIIVTDVRMKHELEFFRRLGAFTVRAEASEKARSKRGILKAQNDKTETDLDDIKDWDFVLYNEGSIEELKDNIKKLSAVLKQKYGDALN